VAVGLAILADMPVTMTLVDQRTIRVPIPATPEEVEDLAAYIVEASDGGCSLKDVSLIMSGSQRDPYPTEVHLVFSA
jgi:hypothetical protein